jgi:hypothetical protein
MTDVLIIVPEITKGMKSIGSKALLVIKDPITIIDYQINQIKKALPDSRITIATGFEADKIVKIIGEKHNVKFIYNNRYKTTNQTECITLQLQENKCKNLLIISNGIIFKEIDFSIHQETMSKIFVIDKPKYNFTIGCSNSHYAEYLFYDLPIVWSECFFLNEEALDMIKAILAKENIEQLYLFELVNKLIDNKIIFEKEYISKKNIMKILNNKDISKAKQFI